VTELEKKSHEGEDLCRNISGWCHRHDFGFFDNGMAYTAPGLLASDEIHLPQRRKRVFAHKLAGLIDRALN